MSYTGVGLYTAQNKINAPMTIVQVLQMKKPTRSTTNKNT